MLVATRVSSSDKLRYIDRRARYHLHWSELQVKVEGEAAWLAGVGKRGAPSTISCPLSTSESYCKTDFELRGLSPPGAETLNHDGQRDQARLKVTELKEGK